MSSEYRSELTASPVPRPRLLSALALTEEHLQREGFRGYDPYDALLSPLFRLPGVRSSKLARLVGQQLLRRAPLNTRPLLRVPKGYNPVTLGLALEAYASLATAQPGRMDELTARAAALVEELERLRTPGFSGACWGYDFPWQSRGVLLRPFAPTVVATVFITNGLFAAHEAFGDEKALALCASACDFVVNDLHRRVEQDGSFCWSYSPFDRNAVLNASAKGSRLLAQVVSVTGREELADSARRSLRFVVRHQREDGSWPYAIADPRDWSDSFHTGYVLDAVDEFERRIGDGEFSPALERGWQHFRRDFFGPGVVPRYYPQSLYPIDATACGQAMLTLCRFGDVEAAARLAGWVVEHFQREDGAFAYRRYRFFTNRIPYMRWSTAWLYCGLARVAAALAEGGQGRV